MSDATSIDPAGRCGGRLERRRALRSVRPRIAVAWVVVLLAASLVLGSPVALAALLAGLVAAGRWLGAGPTVARTLRVGVPFALVLLVIQTVIDRNGVTVIARLGGAGPFGQLDITAEALEGATTQALRVLSGLAVSALGLALVDVDRVLASVRRRVPRFGVAATLALRLAPTLAGDGRRYADGLRSRADARPGGRLGAADRRLVVDALIARTLDRAGDAAGILELRGLNRADCRRGPDPHGAWSDVERSTAAATAAFASALTLLVFAGAGR